ncbi:MAG: MaoC family dehydratase, partial [Chloroflexi bacterium]|nr:MaoC family dehydratase [Chloroflexota bacterium]
KDLNINYMKIVHGGEEYEYHREIYPGDVLTGKTTVASIVEKQGKSGSMDIVTIETVYTDQKNQKVLTARTTIIERK